MMYNRTKRDHSMSRLVLTAGILGAIQGLSWMILSLAAIFLYNGVIKITTSEPTTIREVLYELYMNKDYTEAVSNVSSIIIGPKQLSYFSYIYLAISFGLVVPSFTIIWAWSTGKGGAVYEKTIGCWACVMGVTSLLDLILMALIAHDYGKYNNLTDESIVVLGFEKEVALVSVGIVMTMAARGFVLWIINVTFTVILGRYYRKSSKKNPVERHQQPIDAYMSAPRPWLDSAHYEEPRPDYDNRAFRDDNDNSPQEEMKRSNGINDSNWINNNNNNERYAIRRPHSDIQPSNPYGHNKIAKIGRPTGQRSPPLNVRPPYIPDPDYSPPGSPRVRGVLRPKSNYSMF